MISINEINSFYNQKPIEFVIKQRYLIREDNLYIPRFTLKGAKQIADIPINQPIKPTEEIMTKAIKYGMIFLISYKGEKDNSFAGHERVIYPMVLGKSSKGNILVRGYHLNGWSVSNNRHIEKIWRMFRLDRVLSVTFTGSFYRLPPSGYNMEDRGMRGGIIAKADFNEIRKNQQELVKAQEIQNREEVELGSEEKKFVSIKVKSTDTQLDLMKVNENPYINNLKDFTNLRISFLKSVYGTKYIAILGALGEPGNTVKVMDEKNINLGIYKVLDSTTGDVLRKITKVKGNTIFDLYIFENKI
jgi:hypothetical protein